MLLSDIYLWLSYSHIATPKLNKILEQVSPTQLWDILSDEGKYLLDEKTFNTLKRTHSVDYIERAKQYLEINNVKYVTRADPAYPTALAQTEVNPPPVIYYKGNLDIVREPCIAVVGTRRASQYGKYATNKIVEELAGAFTIVSGLAAGIDAFAHSAALKAGGKTIAVLGSGLFNASPVSNLKLFDEICRDGLVMSEYTPDVHASAYTFPQRNRLISGLSRGVLVVEAAERSGSLITAGCALDQGRDVFAVPGDIDKPRSIGTNNLIKSGAIAVTCASDISDYYSVSLKKSERKIIALDFSEQHVLDMLNEGEKTFDCLAETSGMSVPELNIALSSLIINGLIHEKSKNLYCVS
ncbi:MAG: DNA-processing protein DprA [Clostridiales bacterium]|nr:DNA-processing protein DprA [Clostridiales bacterium]